eukprot:5444_1
MHKFYWNDQLIEFNGALSCVPFDLDDEVQWNVPLCFKIHFYLTRMRRRRSTRGSYAQLRNKINSYLVNGKEIVKLKRSNLGITKEGWEYLHEEVLNKMVLFCQSIFGECADVILVGDFAKSKYLRDKLQREFPNKSFWCLSNTKSHLAVTEGALYWAASVMFDH